MRVRVEPRLCEHQSLRKNGAFPSRSHCRSDGLLKIGVVRRLGVNALAFGSGRSGGSVQFRQGEGVSSDRLEFRNHLFCYYFIHLLVHINLRQTIITGRRLKNLRPAIMVTIGSICVII